jgi:hypothetical protein
VSYLGILKFLSVIKIYDKMSEIPHFWLSALISQMPPYLIFILVSKYAVNMVLSSQKCRILSLIHHTKTKSDTVAVHPQVKFFKYHKNLPGLLEALE